VSAGSAILVTGATGLIGAEVVDRLSSRHSVIAVTHRQPNVIRTDGSTVRSDEYGQSWSGVGVACLAADVREKGFGLAPQVLDELGKAVGCIVHAAATIAFDAPEAEYRSLNIAGTEHAIDLAQRWNVPLIHVSTAYVCGRRSGTIAEDELDSGQEFSNGYERSKCRAEQLVNQATVGSVILRPAIVTGEAGTGAIRDYKNLYTLVKLIVEGKLRRLPGRYDATLCLVPVDYVADAVVAATELVHAGDESILGRTFHLQGANTLSLRQVSDVLAEYPSFEVGTFVPPTAFSVEDLDPIERDYYERIGARYACYFDRIRTFDDHNTRTLLGLAPPVTGADYVRRLLDFCLASGYLGRPLPSVSEVLANEFPLTSAGIVKEVAT
jgi:thioester reductase-like protein